MSGEILYKIGQKTSSCSFFIRKTEESAQLFDPVQSTKLDQDYFKLLTGQQCMAVELNTYIEFFTLSDVIEKSKHA